MTVIGPRDTPEAMNRTKLLQMLAKAAEAAGFQVDRTGDDNDSLLLIGQQEPWRPHREDGQALRLAISCRVYDVASAIVDVAHGGLDAPGDLEATARMAIVHAAAQRWREQLEEGGQAGNGVLRHPSRLVALLNDQAERAVAATARLAADKSALLETLAAVHSAAVDGLAQMSGNGAPAALEHIASLATPFVSPPVAEG